MLLLALSSFPYLKVKTFLLRTSASQKDRIGRVLRTSFFNSLIFQVRKQTFRGNCLKLKSLSRVRLFATPWMIAHQAPLSMGFSRQEYWSGCHFLLQEIFPTQGLNPGFPHCRQTLYPLNHQGKSRWTLKPSVFRMQPLRGPLTPERTHVQEDLLVEGKGQKAETWPLCV